MRSLPIPAIAGIAVAAILLLMALFTVEQTEQVLLTQFGEPVRTITVPGLHIKTPLVQTVIGFDRRLLNFENSGEEVILGDQRRLIVDSFTMYRISDPLRYFQAVGSAEDAIIPRLNSIVSSSLRRVLGNNTLPAVLSADRGRIMGEIRDQVNDEMRGFGVSVEDVRIRRADLPQENTQAILSRMQSERDREARRLRAEGAEASARIRADADRDRTVLLAEAQATSDRLRGEGEQQAIRIYADAFGKDPQFFGIWRTLGAYRDAFGAGASRLVLTPDSPFLRYFRESPASSPP
jgi:membrane protease subunit HflC